jgi:hypothetical protein
VSVLPFGDLTTNVSPSELRTNTAAYAKDRPVSPALLVQTYCKRTGKIRASGPRRASNHDAAGASQLSDSQPRPLAGRSLLVVVFARSRRRRSVVQGRIWHADSLRDTARAAQNVMSKQPLPEGRTISLAIPRRRSDHWIAMKRELMEHLSVLRSSWTSKHQAALHQVDASRGISPSRRAAMGQPAQISWTGPCTFRERKRMSIVCLLPAWTCNEAETEFVCPLEIATVIHRWTVVLLRAGP